MFESYVESCIDRKSFEYQFKKIEHSCCCDLSIEITIYFVIDHHQQFDLEDLS